MMYLSQICLDDRCFEYGYAFASALRCTDCAGGRQSARMIIVSLHSCRGRGFETSTT